MKSIKSEIRLRLLALALCALAAFGANACFWGGDDAEGSVLTTEERLAVLEAQVESFMQYIAAQAELQAANEARQVTVEVGEDGEEVVKTTAYLSPPLYSLKRADASDNEREIVRWMADCASRTYLNPDLPKEVLDREIDQTEDEMWDALESGQYSSFENYIGMAFSFCRAEVVEDSR